MAQNLLDIVKKCSSESKLKISSFLEEIFKEKPKEQEQQSTNDFSSLQELFNQITAPFSVQKSREISKNERVLKLMSNNQYNYGEIKFNTICRTIRKISKIRILGNKQVFYDLGSGSGKVIFAASLCHSFRKCRGIEVLESLFKSSLQLKQRILQNQKRIEQCVLEQQDIDYQLPLIQYLNMDFKDYDWSDGTITFISSTCYSGQLMNKKMKKGSIFVTLTRKLDQQQVFWKVVQKFQGESSWGQTTIYIQTKIL